MTKIIKKQERISIKKSFFNHSKKNNKSVTLITIPLKHNNLFFLEKSVIYSQCFYKKNVILHYYVINVK